MTVIVVNGPCGSDHQWIKNSLLHINQKSSYASQQWLVKHLEAFGKSKKIYFSFKRATYNDRNSSSREVNSIKTVRNKFGGKQSGQVVPKNLNKTRKCAVLDETAKLRLFPPERYQCTMENTWYNVVIMAVFLVMGSVLNLMVLILTLLTPSLRTINNEFICHTSAVSFTGCSVLFSISLYEITSYTLDYTLDSNTSAKNLCKAEQIVGIVCFSCSAVLLFVFGLYRFMSAVRPLTTLVHVRLNTLRILLFLPWIVAGFVAFILNIDPDSQCQFGSWDNINQSAFIVFFCVIVVFPVISLSAFFVAIILKTRENRRKNAEVQVYHEHQIMKSVGSSQAHSQAALVMKNPTFDENFKANKWDGVRDLTQLSLNSNEQLAALPRTPSISSRSSDSIFDKLERSGAEMDEKSFRDTSGEGNYNIGEANSPDQKEKLRNEESIEKDSDDDAGSREVKSISDTSYPSDQEVKNSDVELDFILPQPDNEDFLQDMMAALHKSFRESKHSIASRTSIESINFEGSASSLNSQSQQHRLPSEPSEQATERFRKMLLQNKSGVESRADSENKTFDGPDSEPSLPATPTFHPPPPPQQARKDSAVSQEDENTRPSTLQLSTQLSTSLLDEIDPEALYTNVQPRLNPKGDASSSSFSLPPLLSEQPPPLPAQPPPSDPPSPRDSPRAGDSPSLGDSPRACDSPRADKPPPLPAQLPPGDLEHLALQTLQKQGTPPPLPSRPPPGDSPPSAPRPTCPASRSHSGHHSGSDSSNTDSFTKSEGDGRSRKSCDQPIDKWLMDRVLTMEGTQVGSSLSNPREGTLIRDNGSANPAITGETSLRSTTRSNGESFSEGYSTNVLLLLYCILFFLFQVQHAVVTLHTILNPAVEVPLYKTVSYTLHLIYYTLNPVVTLSICTPLKTVLYNKAVQIGVCCVDGLDWCQGLSLGRNRDET